MLPGMLAGAVVAAGVVTIVLALVRTTPRLDAAIARLGDDLPATASTTGEVASTWKDRLGAAAERTLAGRTGFTTPTRELQLVGKSPRWYWGEKSSAALVGLTAPIFLGTLNLLLGAPIPAAAPLALSLGAAAWFWVMPDAQVKKQAATARADFSRAAVAYLQLMCINRSAGDGALTSMRGAAEVSDAWMFVRIREEIARASLAGIPAWDGLTQLGERTGIPELREVGDIMRLAGESGAGVTDSLLARARSMRDAILAQEHAKALNRANEINIPLVGIVLLVVALIGVPAVYSFLIT